jgi:hypothetical protein
MKMIRSLLTVIIFTILIYSCKKDNSTSNLQEFIKCNDDMKLDSAGIANKLVGKWKLKSWYCSFCIDPGSHKSDVNVTVTFTSASQFVISENSVARSHGNWSLKSVYPKWELESDSSLGYMYGNILFCGNQVMFSASERDGADNLFERLN